MEDDVVTIHPKNGDKPGNFPSWLKMYAQLKQGDLKNETRENTLIRFRHVSSDFVEGFQVDDFSFDWWYIKQKALDEVVAAIPSSNILRGMQALKELQIAFRHEEFADKELQLVNKLIQVAITLEKNNLS
jgi:hypothetical protein